MLASHEMALSIGRAPNARSTEGDKQFDTQTVLLAPAIAAHHRHDGRYFHYGSIHTQKRLVLNFVVSIRHRHYRNGLVAKGRDVVLLAEGIN